MAKKKVVKKAEEKPVSVATEHRMMLKTLRLDLKNASKILTPEEARYTVDLYYQVQNYRIRAEAQKKATARAKCLKCGELCSWKYTKTKDRVIIAHVVTDGDGGETDCEGAGEIATEIVSEPNALVTWLFEEFEGIEKMIQSSMDTFSDQSPVGQWMKSLYGIGPVIAGGLLAHIDITRAPTVGHIWNFAGLNPKVKWEKGKKRPWNAELRTLCWKAGESFVKTCNKDGDVYGHLYLKRKAVELEQNAKKAFADQAKEALETKTWKKDTEAYKAYVQGLLPPARIHARAKRWAVKLFLSHLHTVWYFVHYGKMPPKPFVLAHLGHAHYIPVPHAELIPGLAEALKEHES